jgi:hypothetical protein
MAHHVELKFNQATTSRAEIHAAIDLMLTSVRGGLGEFCNTCGLGGIDVYLTGVDPGDFASERETVPGVLSMNIERRD